MTIRTDMWVGFAVIMTVIFILDLGVFNRKSHEISFREALTWTLVWVSLAFFFNIGIYYFLGQEKAMEFLTGYLIEESLSVDNLFVFIMIFSYFRVSPAYQPKILKWGILGALAMRGVFIMAGIGLMERFHWILFIFGGLLVFTGIKMAFGGEQKIEPEKNLLVRLVSRYFPVSHGTHGSQIGRAHV
jgi:tellurite resistance protein TerC